MVETLRELLQETQQTQEEDMQTTIQEAVEMLTKEIATMEKERRGGRIKE